MILSEEHKLIFIHIPRTGGTSIRAMFNFPLLGHAMPAKMFMERIGKEKYDQYFKFTVVRNPWDRMVSYYHFLRDDPIGSNYKYPGGLAEGEGFKEWCVRRFTPPMQHFPNGDYYTGKWLGDSKGNLLVDKVLYFDNLKADLQDMLTPYNISNTLPHLNQSARMPYQNYYDDAAREIVAKNFSKDITLFGFTY